MSKALENYHKKTDSIIASAKKLFLTNGYTATNMDDIAKNAQLTKQTIYRYFPSKAELFRSVLKSCTDSAPARHVFGENSTALELFDYSVAFIRYHTSKDHIDTLRLILAEKNKTVDLNLMFYNMGPQKGITSLASFLKKRFPGMDDAEKKAEFLMSMLVSLRFPVLLNVKKAPTDIEIKIHAEKVVSFFIEKLPDTYEAMHYENIAD